jgi:hypothetical protein
MSSSRSSLRPQLAYRRDLRPPRGGDRRRINRLLINVPPGSSKSLIVSVLWPAWEWGPKGLRSLRYLTTSFNDGPVKRDTRKTRDLMLSDWYRRSGPRWC